MQIGTLPVYEDPQTGEVYADVGAVQRSANLGRFAGIGRQPIAPVAAVQRPRAPSMADAYQAAAAGGMVQENQFDGLGSTSVGAGVTGSLTNTVNRTYWVKSIVLTASAGAGTMLVTAITIAGLPLNIGSNGVPVEMFGSTSTRFGLSFGRRLVQTGQVVLVSLSNAGAAAVSVAGGLIVDEVNPYAAQKWTEQTLLAAATNGFGLGR